MTTQAILKSFKITDQAKDVLRGRKSFYIRTRLIQHSGGQSQTEAPAFLLEDLQPGEGVAFDSLEVAKKTLFNVKLLPDTTFITDFYAIRKPSIFGKLLRGIGGALITEGKTKIKTINGLVTVIIAVGAVVANLLLNSTEKKVPKPILIARATLTGEMMGSQKDHMLELKSVKPVFLERIKRVNEKEQIEETIDRYLKQGTVIGNLFFSTMN
jgi:hypothetical protein